jgi:hypothetical protein
MAAWAHEHGEKEAHNWLVSHYEPGALTLKPDESLEEWHGAKMLTVEQDGHNPINLMSIHNETYLMILAESEVNSSFSNDGVAISFMSEESNRSMAVDWVWVGGRGEAVNGSAVLSVGVLNGSELVVVFGSAISSIGNGIGLKVGEPYNDFMRVLFWDNGVIPTPMELSGAPPIGLELIPYIDHYPKLPILYSVVILISGIGFIIMEARKYTR